ncbi:cyclic nucleotide-binding domain-containing protein [uncultured Clostridium sp.]|uniref:cyclic nucleotide-binding domain-containing protein n=1 Tax=uncultured Clostridium sp. TaxID=59620 RepID=UPI0025DE24D3|nr:cyclic nucleotide-binding domain-containing protein [uncultured Clostridium sp.]
MIKVNDEKLKEKYINKYNLNNIFSNDMKEYMELILFEKNQYICKENEEINYLYFFVEGKAKVYTVLKNGKSLLVCFYRPLMILGDLEIISLNKAMTNIQVVEDSYCIALSFNKVRDILLEDSKYLRYNCETISNKLKQSSINGSINLLYPLENRVSGYILATSERHNDNSLRFYGNLTEMAELLATSYRHLLRTLRDLIDKGILRKRSGYYEIMEVEILKNLSSELYK